MNIGIVGSRRRNTDEDKHMLEEVFSCLVDKDTVVVSGGCKKGGDKFAEELAETYNVPILLHLPDKSKLPRNPQRWHFAEINYERNQWIARDSDILIALVACDRKGGTEDTIKHFIKTYKKPRKNLIIITKAGVEKPYGFDI